MTARVTATKKAAAKKAAPPAPAQAAAARSANAPFEPLRLSSTPTEPPEMVDLFEVDGVMYQVPLKPSASISLQYLDLVEKYGESAANLYAIRELLGPEGYKALSGCKTLQMEHLEWLVETIQGLVLGTVEAPKA